MNSQASLIHTLNSAIYQPHPCGTRLIKLCNLYIAILNPRLVSIFYTQLTGTLSVVLRCKQGGWDPPACVLIKPTSLNGPNVSA